MKKLFLVFCLLAPVGLTKADRIDSLKRVFQQMDSQTASPVRNAQRVEVLKALMKSYMEFNVDSAIHYNQFLITACRQSGFQNELIYAHYYTGLIHQIQGKEYESIQSFYQTLAMAEKQKLYTQMAALYGGLAHAYSRLNQLPKALKLCRQGLTILRVHPDSAAYARQLSLLNTAGVIYRKLGRFSDAFTTNQAMYDLARRKPYDRWYEAHGLHAIGLVHKALGHIPEAISYHKQALALARHVNSVVLEGNILLNTADLYIQQKQWPAALHYCLEAKQMASRVKNSNILAEAHEKLYLIYKNLGQPTKALNAYEAFNALKDSLSREQTQQRIKTLQAEYDNVQKTNDLQRKQVELLQMTQTRNGLIVGLTGIILIATLLVWNNQRLQAKNQKIDLQRTMLETAHKQLADSNKTLEIRVEERTNELLKANQELTQQNEKIREALFKGQTIERKRVALELHDNLSSLLSAVNMSIQSINAKNLSAPEQSIYHHVRQLIQNAYTEVRNISHNILPADLEREGLVTALTALVDRLNQSTPLKFTLTVSGVSERPPLEIEFNLYSIVLELINNALKHAQATALTITLANTPVGMHVSVTDDGIGMGQTQTKRGIGLQNIHTRLDALGGSFQAIAPDGKGTQINIKIPIDAYGINGNGHTT